MRRIRKRKGRRTFEFFEDFEDFSVRMSLTKSILEEEEEDDFSSDRSDDTKMQELFLRPGSLKQVPDQVDLRRRFCARSSNFSL